MSIFTSDIHLGHKNIYKYRPMFVSATEHDEFMLHLLSKLTKRDTLFILGDFIFPSETYEQTLAAIAKMPVTIKLVLGNHDNMHICNNPPSNIKILNPLQTYKQFWLSHCPIHPQEFRGRILSVHGHLHNDIIKINGKPDYMHFNVNLDNNYFKPVPFEEIVEYSKKLHP